MSLEDKLEVRELRPLDVPLLCDYWMKATPEFLTGMGVDLKKLPDREQFAAMLAEQLSQSIPQKQSYCVIWVLNGNPVGHSNINKIRFGEEAFMHLHLWPSAARKKGLGTEFVKLSLPWYFENYKLKTLFCEPYALNPAPNKTLEKVGFKFIKEHICIPGWLNFEQPVKLWEMTEEMYNRQIKKEQ